jgi:hypothetical protein
LFFSSQETAKDLTRDKNKMVKDLPSSAATKAVLDISLQQALKQVFELS